MPGNKFASRRSGTVELPPKMGIGLSVGQLRLEVATEPTLKVTQRLAAVLVGAMIGAAIGLPLFGYPPADVNVGAEGGGPPCGVIPSPQSTLLAEIVGSEEFHASFASNWVEVGGTGSPPSLTVAPARCGDGVRVWGMPIRPERRAQWIRALDESLNVTMTNATLSSMVTELDIERELLEQEVLERSVQLVADLRSIELEESLPSGFDRREVLDEILVSMSTIRQALDDVLRRIDVVDAQVRRLAASDDLVEKIQDDATVVIPPGPLFPIAMSTLLGALAGFLVAGTIEVIRRMLRDDRHLGRVQDMS